HAGVHSISARPLRRYRLVPNGTVPGVFLLPPGSDSRDRRRTLEEAPEDEASGKGAPAVGRQRTSAERRRVLATSAPPGATRLGAEPIREVGRGDGPAYERAPRRLGNAPPAGDRRRNEHAHHGDYQRDALWGRCAVEEQNVGGSGTNAFGDRRRRDEASLYPATLAPHRAQPVCGSRHSDLAGPATVK